MFVDYSVIFKTPDELAGFLMLGNAEQIKLLAGYASQTGKLQFICSLPAQTEKSCPTLPCK